MSLPRRLNSTHGMSIVEILVVMVVLLVGIMSVVSMFPGGFKAVRHAESMTFADRLAQGEMERWKNQADHLPWGVVPIDIDSGVMTVLNGLTPNPPINDDKAFKFRRVLGETTKIPVGTPFRSFGAAPGGIEQASIYTVAYAPIDYDPSRTSSVDTQYKDLVITGGDMRRREMEAGDDDDVRRLRQGEYGIDYESITNSTFQMCFPILGKDAVYYVSYSYWVLADGKTRPEIRSAVEQEVIVPANTEAWIPVSFPTITGATFIRMEEGSDTCARGFVEITNYDQTWDDYYPYEYRIVDPVLGTIAFNPYGYKAMEQTPRGMQPLEAHISYNIRDLSIMRDDRRVDSTGRVKLSLKYIRKLGEPLQPHEGDGVYEGIFKVLPSGFTNADILAIDLSTGTKLNLDPSFGVTIDHENGIVQFPQDYRFTVGPGVEYALTGRNIRFLYKAEGDWSLQLQKAYELYRRDYGGNKVDYRSYGVSALDTTKEVWLRFAGCESGKTIAVDYAYTDQNLIEHKVVGEAHMVPDSTSSRFGGPTDYWVKLDFTDPAKYGQNADTLNTLTRIYSVYGVSLKIRVLWREGARWRYVDKDTSLMRRTSEV